VTGAERIAAERKRQVEEEGWNASHDAEHENDELAAAALAYLASYLGNFPMARDWWPWDNPGTTWAPNKSLARRLEIAGALIAAELDRLEVDAHSGREGVGS
jgi:hypothetical protein